MARARFDRDYYGTMGLHPEATEDEIKRSYRRLALEWHPDRNPGNPHAEERFKEISEAYAVLIDPVKRRDYDRARHTGVTGDFNPRREDLFRDLFADPRASAIFEDLAREFERMGMRVNRQYFHQTLFRGRAVVTGGVFVISPLTPALALFRLARAAFSPRANAAVERGAAGTLPRPPRAVGALGRLGRWLLGLPASTVTSGATDVTIPLPLTRTEADGGVRKRVTLNRGDDIDELVVTVPAGIRSGTRLRLRGKGRATPGGGRGDAYLEVEITERS
jgi:curved DNA-binding protein CbpA